MEDFDFRSQGAKLELVSYNFNGTPRFLRCIFPDARFNDSIFLKGAEFSDCIFEGDCIFAGSHSRGNVGLNFRASKFNRLANFQQMIVDGSLGFERIEASQVFLLDTHSSAPEVIGIHAKFHGGATMRGSFASATFAGASFTQPFECRNASFEGDVDFRGCKFEGGLELDGRIAGTADLSRMHVKGFAWLRGVQFENHVDLKDSVFERHADFDATSNATTIPSLDAEGATFKEICSFNGRTFGGDTSFRATTFEKAPEFHNCELFPATDFTKVKLHDWKSPHAEASYRSLRQACNEIEDHHNEIFFFSQEMRARRAKQGLVLKGLYGLYEALSNYGLSVWLPLRAFMALLLIAFATYGALDLFTDSNRKCIQAPHCSMELQSTKVESIGTFALAQAVPFVPAVKEAAQKPSALWPGHPMLQLVIELVAVLHALVSVVLLFLVVLGLRNQFRLG